MPRYVQNVIFSGTIFLLLNFLIWRLTALENEWITYIYYILISTSFIGMPHEPLVFYFGKIHGPYMPVLMAVIPTLTGCYLDYMVLGPLLNSSFFNRFKNGKFYLNIERWFHKYPFLTIMLTSVSPVPFYPIRVISIASNYSAHKYSGAVLIGRIPRFFFLAVGGKLLNIPDNYIILVFVIAFIWYISVFLYKKVIRSRLFNTVKN